MYIKINCKNKDLYFLDYYKGYDKIIGLNKLILFIIFI